MAADLLRRLSAWTPTSRALVFGLASTSIGCLLSELYGVAPMRAFAVAAFGPAAALLVAMGVASGTLGDGRLARNLLAGCVAGLLAAAAYDVFRVPFVSARQWGIAGVVPALALFKVFPAFGAMILGQPAGPGSYEPVVHLVGWAYHFSNGAAFGVMYLALVGDAARRSWLWAVLFAAGLELGMLLTPYPAVFGIRVTGEFVAVTLSAHVVFGVVLGLGARRLGAVSHPAR